MAAADSRCFHSGFTLVELMVVLAIVLLTYALAAPVFSRMMEGTRIRAEATRLMGDIVVTRSEAIKRNRQVVMCPSSSNEEGVTECGDAYARGWILFEDTNGDGNPDTHERVIRSGRSLSPGLRVTNRGATREAGEKIKFQPDGSSRRNLTLMVCSDKVSGIDSWSVVMNLVGRPRMARAWGTCPQAAG